jgi:cytochrome P450
MATLVSELDLPDHTLIDRNFEERFALRKNLRDDQWLVKNLFGYAVLRYEDVIGILRDKRWHSATSRIPELMGVTRQDFIQRQRSSILSTEGDEHTRLRRLVAPTSSPT